MRDTALPAVGGPESIVDTPVSLHERALLLAGLGSNDPEKVAQDMPLGCADCPFRPLEVGGSGVCSMVDFVFKELHLASAGDAPEDLHPWTMASIKHASPSVSPQEVRTDQVRLARRSRYMMRLLLNFGEMGYDGRKADTPKFGDEHVNVCIRPLAERATRHALQVPDTFVGAIRTCYAVQRAEDE